MKVTKCDDENEVMFRKFTNEANGSKPAMFGDKEDVSGVTIN
jgi:hypothetical protein